MTETVLLTGAAGRIGAMLRTRLTRHGRRLRLLDIAPITDPRPDEELVTGSFTDPAVLAAALDGVTAIVHMAAIVGEDRWETIHSVNIDGMRTLMEGARLAGISRLVLGSSSNVVGFHTRAEEPLPADLPPRPDGYYGLSKVVMEAFGSLYADRFGMDIACLRIGACVQTPPDVRSLATWLSPDDAGRLVNACLDAPPFGFRLIWGVSDNTRRWWSLDAGKAIGYVPLDDSERMFAAQLIYEQGGLDPKNPDSNRVGGAAGRRLLGERLLGERL